MSDTNFNNQGQAAQNAQTAADAKAQAWVESEPGSPEAAEQAYMAKQGNAPSVANPHRARVWVIVIAIIVALAIILTVGYGQSWFGANEQMVADENIEMAD